MVPRTAVFANDVPVGQVTDVERVGWHARVKFLVRKDVELPENVEVDVRQTSLLGEKYIALVEPAAGTASAKRLSDGDFIPLSRTSRNPEVEEVLGALSMLLSGGGIGQLKTISHELNNMMNGRQDQARHLLGNLDRMIGGLDEQKDDIIAAMESIDRLSSTLVKEKDVIGEAIDSMGPALKVLNRQHKALMTMLRQLDKLGEVGTRVLNASTDNIVASLRHLQPTLTKLGDAGDSLADRPVDAGQLPVPQGGRQHRPRRLRQRAVPHGHRPEQGHQVAGRGAAQPDQPVQCHAAEADAVPGLSPASARRPSARSAPTGRGSATSLCPPRQQGACEDSEPAPAARPGPAGSRRSLGLLGRQRRPRRSPRPRREVADG